MTHAFFDAAGPGLYEPQPHVVGPWDPALMHGGPPSALLAHEILRTVDPGQVPPDPLLARMTVEFLSAVPATAVEVIVSVVRPGRRIALVEAQLAAGGRPALLARAWLVRQESVEVPVTRLDAAPPDVPLEVVTPRGWNPGYLQAVEWGWVAGRFEEPGPTTAWARPRMPLVSGRELSGVERILLVADSGNGLSAVADPSRLIFVNTELTVHMWRRPVGDRVWVRAESFLGPSGTGLASTVLGDVEGAVGSGAQSLFLATRHMG